jgi:hypothetical protein
LLQVEDFVYHFSKKMMKKIMFLRTIHLPFFLLLSLFSEAFFFQKIQRKSFSFSHSYSYSSSSSSSSSLSFSFLKKLFAIPNYNYSPIADELNGNGWNTDAGSEFLQKYWQKKPVLIRLGLELGLGLGLDSNPNNNTNPNPNPNPNPDPY